MSLISAAIVANYSIGWLLTSRFISDCKYGDKQTLNPSEKLQLLMIFLTGLAGICLGVVVYFTYHLVILFFDIVTDNFKELFK